MKLCVEVEVVLNNVVVLYGNIFRLQCNIPNRSLKITRAIMDAIVIVYRYSNIYKKIIKFQKSPIYTQFSSKWINLNLISTFYRIFYHTNTVQLWSKYSFPRLFRRGRFLIHSIWFCAARFLSSIEAHHYLMILYRNI